MRITTRLFLGPTGALALVAACSSTPDQPSGAGGAAPAPRRRERAASRRDHRRDQRLGDERRADDGRRTAAGVLGRGRHPGGQNVVMVKFLNRTNGKYPDSQVYWSYNGQAHSIAEQPYFDMPANSAGRMYFYLGSPEQPVLRLHRVHRRRRRCSTATPPGSTRSASRSPCGCTPTTATMSRSARTTRPSRRTAPSPSRSSSTRCRPSSSSWPRSRRRIGSSSLEPGSSRSARRASITTIATPIDLVGQRAQFPQARPRTERAYGSYPDVSAALMRHVGGVAGTFSPDGKLLNKDLWTDDTTFYTTAPADYYAKFWHTHGLRGKAYGFPYDDVGSYSSYVSHKDPQ